MIECEPSSLYSYIEDPKKFPILAGSNSNQIFFFCICNLNIEQFFCNITSVNKRFPASYVDPAHNFERFLIPGFLLNMFAITLELVYS